MESTSSKEDVSFDPFFDEDEDANEFAMRRASSPCSPRLSRSTLHSRYGWKRKRAHRR